MAKRNLTDRSLKSLKPAISGKHYDVMDSVVPGFGVRVSDTGRRTFILIKRFPGSKNPTRLALGEFGELSLEKARSKARDWLELIRAGKHPKDEEERQRVVEQRKRTNSFRAVAEDFINLALRNQRKGPEVKRHIEHEFIARWNGRPITDISAHDVIAVLDDAVGRGAPYQAHNLLGDIRRLFNWAIARGVYGTAFPVRQNAAQGRYWREGGTDPRL